MSDFTTLVNRVQAAGLMRRRHAYYWTKVVAMVLLIGAVLVMFVWIGDSWWQLVTAAVLAVVFTQAAFLGWPAGSSRTCWSGSAKAGGPELSQGPLSQRHTHS